MRVLVACEESQAVTIELRKLGHEAFSADILDCSGGYPEWHLKGDVIPLLSEKWDMIIAFPPCTYLSNAGAARLFPQKGNIDIDRYRKGLKAKDFFMSIYNADCEKIAIENPVATSVFRLPEHDQEIEPYQFGHPYSKKTRLWLRGLPLLQPTKIITENLISWVSGGSKDHNGNKRQNCGMTFRDSKTKSKTFPGIAKAMAEQWTKKGVKIQDTLFW
jgi:hypothetical protein